jgi:hypothetical protein
MEKFTQFLNFLSYKYKVSFEDVMKDYEEFVKEEKDILLKSDLHQDYKTFIEKNEEELENTFNIKNNFQTSVRGVKVRGVFATKEEAEFRCKILRELDPVHDIYVGCVGVWMPWEPESYKTGHTEYLEEELNQLMSEKNKNEKYAKNAFEERVKETKKKAIDENIKMAEKTGNVLTQTIDENGVLMGISTQENNLKYLKNEEISVADISKELFEGENIITGKSDNGKSLLKNDVFK